MAAVVYLLCTLSCAVCAVLLLRTHRAGASRFVLWSTVAFLGLTAGNALLFIDLVLVPTADLMLYRQLVTFLSVTALMWGFVWETR
jgi:hypothetical protein